MSDIQAADDSNMYMIYNVATQKLVILLYFCYCSLRRHQSCIQDPRFAFQLSEVGAVHSLTAAGQVVKSAAARVPGRRMYTGMSVAQSVLVCLLLRSMHCLNKE